PCLGAQLRRPVHQSAASRACAGSQCDFRRLSRGHRFHSGPYLEPPRGRVTMNWELVFSLVNLWALLAWIALIVLPRGDFVKALVFYAAIGFLCAAYTMLIVLLLSGTVYGEPAEGAGGASFTTIEG